MTQDPRINLLVKLARQSTSTWRELADDAFRGEVSVETKNTVYRFEDGVFVSRAEKPAGAPESPPALRGVRLIGFLAYERALWTFSPRWQKGSFAAIWKPGAYDERSFALTSATVKYVAAPAIKAAPSPPPTVRKLPPSSNTRIVRAAASPGYR